MNKHDSINLLLISAKITTLISFFPSLIAILKWRFFKEKPLRWLFYYLTVLALLNLFSVEFVDFATKYYNDIGPTLKKLNINNTFFIEPFYSLNEIIFIGLFCREIIENEVKKRQILGLIWILVSFILLNTLFFEGYQKSQEIGSLLNNAVLLYFIYLIMNQVFTSHLKVNLVKSPIRYIVISLLISTLVVTLLDFIANRMFTETVSLFYQVHIFVNIFYVVSLILMCIGFYLVNSNKLQ